MSKKSQTTKSTNDVAKSPLIEQAIARARAMKPAARAEFLRRHTATEISEIHAALVGEAKPKTPRPILEKRILHALFENTPSPAHLDQDTSIPLAGNDDAIAAASAEAPTDLAASKPLDEALGESPTAVANAASWDGALPEPGYVPPAGTGEEPADADDADDETRSGDAATANADTAGSAPTGEPGAGNNDAGAGQRGRAPRERDPRLPSLGTVIIKRDRHGTERVRCTIVEAGVEYGGTTYKSISSAAMAAAKDLGLASKTQDGYSFWGLKKATERGGAKKSPVDALEKAWGHYRERAEAAVKNASAEDKERVREALSAHSTALLGLTGAAAASTEAA